MNKVKIKKAIVLGGSRGIGEAIVHGLRKIKCEVVAASSKDINTANIESVKRFSKKYTTTDILVLNTGGPPKKDFFKITEAEWDQYYKQLFLSFCLLLQRIKINNGGYIFLITSHHIKRPHPKMALSVAYRVAFWSVLRGLVRYYAEKNISCINIAPGPIKTDRLKNLTRDIKKLEDSLPFKRAGDPEEIGNLIKSIVENNIKYLNGVVINFDGGLSDYIF
jgi:3-oxoacyl-[acyl-carrier protein] reductase